jgi:type IV pilus assembly protein PilM
MVFSPFQAKKRMASLIIKDHVIRYVETKANQPLTVYQCGEHYLPAGIVREGKVVDWETFMLILEECIDEWKLRKRRVLLLIPDSVVVLRIQSVPAEIPNEEIRGYVYMEMGTNVHLPFEEPIFDYVILKDEGDKKEILLFAAPEDVVLDYKSVIEHLGLKPIVMDVSSLALYRLFHQQDVTNTHDYFMMIQFDLDAVNITIFHEHKPLFMRHYSLQEYLLQWDIQVGRTGTVRQIRWGGTEKEYEDMMIDISREIDRLMSYFRYSMMQGKREITKVLLCGDHPGRAELFLQLEQVYNLPVMTINEHSINFVRRDEHDETTVEPFYLPIGLALKEVT